MVRSTRKRISQLFIKPNIMNKLITKEILAELKANDELSQQGMNRLDMVPVLRLFTPDAAATWGRAGREGSG